MIPEEISQNHWFAKNVEPHESMLRAWLRGRYANDGDIDDIVQESYLRVLRAKETTEIKSPKTFLFTIARNVAISHRRRLKTSACEPIVESANSNVIDISEAIPEVVSRNQEYELLKKAIATLPEKRRKIFIMRQIHGKTQKEIARELGISTHTVSAQLTNGLHKCLAYFEKYRKEIKR